MRKFFIALFAVITVILFACNNNAPQGGTNSPLEGTSWKLTGLSALPNGLPTLSREVTIRLDTSRVAGFAGCNRYFGSYATSGNALKFTGVASTKMFCQGMMEVEDGLLQSINNTDAWHINGTRLALLKGTDTLARFEASKAAEQ